MGWAQIFREVNGRELFGACEAHLQVLEHSFPVFADPAVFVIFLYLTVCVFSLYLCV